MISLYIIAGFFLAVGVVKLSRSYKIDKLDGLACVAFAALILAFTEWARATGVF